MKKLYFLFIILISTASFGQVINEVDADTPGTDVAEFIEILWTPNTALDGLVVVLFNGSSDTSYTAIDLDGFSTDANGFFMLADTGVSDKDYDLGTSNKVQNGADAVALYTGNDTDFPDATAVTAVNLLSGVVYDTGDGDDDGLLAVIGGVQYDERENSNSDGQSIQRNSDGTYSVKNITYRAENDAATCELSLGSISAICDVFTTGTDTYTATIGFTGGGTSTYTVSADSGTVDLSGGNDPSVDASGTITITGLSEGVDVIVTVQNGGLCDLSSMITSPVCEPSLALPLYDGFDYTTGANLIDAPDWENTSTSSDEVLVSTGSLSYTGLAASTGNSISFDGVGSDPLIQFTPVSSGTAYASFMFKVTDQSAITDLGDGGYFAVLGSFDARVWVRPDTDPVGTTFDIGFGNGSSNPPTTTSTYNVGDVIFIVMSYETGTGVLNIWVNPTDTSFGAASAPAVTMTETDATPSASIDQFVVRQDSAGETPFIEFDELRIGTSWADVTPTTTASIGKSEIEGFAIYPNPVSRGEFSIRTRNGVSKSVQIFDMLGKQVYSKEVQSNENVRISNLNAGIYILKVQEEGRLATRKLVVE